MAPAGPQHNYCFLAGGEMIHENLYHIETFIKMSTGMNTADVPYIQGQHLHRGADKKDHFELIEPDRQ